MLVAEPPSELQAGLLFRGLLLAIIARQEDPREQEAMLAIMRKDGHLPEREVAA